MPDGNKNDQNIHIDTFYLQSYLMGREESEREATKQVKEAIRRAKNNGDIFIKFFFLVIAELINNVKLQERNVEKRKEIFQDLFKLLENSKIDIEPPKGDSLEVAASIKSQESDLNLTDILIVAHALCDNCSTILLMNDSDILESKIIDKIKKRDGRFHKLEIKDSIS